LHFKHIVEQTRNMLPYIIPWQIGLLSLVSKYPF